MAQNPLGNSQQYFNYVDQYDASLLFPIPRQEKRQELGISETHLPFQGADFWTGFELSWLDDKGKPHVALLEVEIPAQSSHLIESKSFKLYLNSFNQTKISSQGKVQERIQQDLSQALGLAVKVKVTELSALHEIPIFSGPSGAALSLDDLDVEIETYSYAPEVLRSGGEKVSEKLFSNLLKSNCLITGQPDWGSVLISYQGPQIDHKSLLRYLISFRAHNEFHEQCVERIFVDLKKYCGCEKLSVMARYTRRGGLDINPFRSDFEASPSLPNRLIRQ